MLRLAELLCLAGLHITFVVSEFSHARLLNNSNVVSRFAGYPGFRFQTIPDGLPDDHPRSGEAFGDVVPAIKNVAAPLFKKMMAEKDFFSSPTRRPCIIADGVCMSFAIDFAEDNGIDIIFFPTVSACSFWATFCIPELIEAKAAPLQRIGREKIYGILDCQR
ncbi:OLC1v1026679C1 [Oldenlandia corymbosa var. corymbosa]|uniref:OLC1v1026679C1 n=1 Tax=Oldenlandia corymbosa var. corymbosa TaxID=529605 RepID=A0AAV1CAY4_OLDCO|nr:OLC1v1026679C1 [Oldenlandia corymbosa var. corymbosa]